MSRSKAASPDSPLEQASAYPRQITSIFQQDAKAASDPTHFGTHPEDPVSSARWRTTADEDSAARPEARVGGKYAENLAGAHLFRQRVADWSRVSRSYSRAR